MAGKRRFAGTQRSFKRAKTFRRPTRSVTRGKRVAGGSLAKRAAAGVQRLTRMIETKESARVQTVATNLAHNNIVVMGTNPFITIPGVGDPMSGTGNRIGDQISVQGLLIRGFLENSLGRSKVHYRIMLIRGAKGEPFDRNTLFKAIVDNKLIDQINTERYSIVASKRMTLTCANDAPASVGPTGVPGTSTPSGISGRPWSMWIPGVKFGKRGNVRYQDGEQGQVKFYDYRICVLAYDWYGTPQDVNNVGQMSSMYTKLYYKDA